MLVSMAWRNVLRNPRRSFLTSSAMAIAVGFLMVALALTEGMYGQLRDQAITTSIGHVQVHHPDWPGRRQLTDTLDDADARLARLDADPAVRGVAPRLYGNALLGGAERTEGAQLVGVDPAREEALRRIGAKIVDGAWLPPEASRAIVLGDDLAERLDVKVGGEVVAVTQAADGSLGNDLYRVVGVVRTGSPVFDRTAAFLHRSDLGELLVLPGRVHELVVVGERDDDAHVAALADAVRHDVGDGRSLVRTWHEVEPTTAQMFAMQGFSTWLMIGFFYGVAAVGIVNTLLMAVFERTRELGVLRAIGLRGRQVVQLVLLEALMLAGLAILFGGALGALGDWALVRYGLDLSIDGKGWEMGTMTFDPVIHGRVTVGSVARPVVGVVLFSLVAAIWPAVRAARIRPADAIRGA